MATTSEDGNGDGVIDAADYTVWRDHLGITTGSGAALASASPLSAAVPEPATIVLAMIAGFLLCVRPRAADKNNC